MRATDELDRGGGLPNANYPDPKKLPDCRNHEALANRSDAVRLYSRVAFAEFACDGFLRVQSK